MGLVWFALGMLAGAALVGLILYAGMVTVEEEYRHRTEGWGE